MTTTLHRTISPLAVAYPKVLLRSTTTVSNPSLLSTCTYSQSTSQPPQSSTPASSASLLSSTVLLSEPRSPSSERYAKVFSRATRKTGTVYRCLLETDAVASAQLKLPSRWTIQGDRRIEVTKKFQPLVTDQNILCLCINDSRIVRIITASFPFNDDVAIMMTNMRLEGVVITLSQAFSLLLSSCGENIVSEYFQDLKMAVGFASLMETQSIHDSSALLNQTRRDCDLRFNLDALTIMITLFLEQAELVALYIEVNAITGSNSKQQPTVFWPGILKSVWVGKSCLRLEIEWRWNRAKAREEAIFTYSKAGTELTHNLILAGANVTAGNRWLFSRAPEAPPGIQVF